MPSKKNPLGTDRKRETIHLLSERAWQGFFPLYRDPFNDVVWRKNYFGVKGFPPCSRHVFRLAYWFSVIGACWRFKTWTGLHSVVKCKHILFRLLFGTCVLIAPWEMEVIWQVFDFSSRSLPAVCQMSVAFYLICLLQPKQLAWKWRSKYFAA